MMTAICIGLLTTLTASAATKGHYQPVDLSSNHLSVLATTPKVLADDFLCIDPIPVTHVEIWGSWYNGTAVPEIPPKPADIRLSIHDDIPDPDGAGPLYSKPGALRWEKTFTPAEYTVTNAAQGLTTAWYDPNTGAFLTVGYAVVDKYTFDIAEVDAFVQEGTHAVPRTYWLDVEVFPEDPQEEFGWKASTVHWNDDAVWGDMPNPTWGELRYPDGHQYHDDSIDLAFIIEGEAADEPVVPEPAGLGLIGLALLAVRRRRG